MILDHRHWYLAGWLHHLNARRVAVVYDAPGDAPGLSLALRPGDLEGMRLTESRQLVCLLTLAARQRTPDGESRTELGVVRAEWRRCADITDDHHLAEELEHLPIDVISAPPHGRYLALQPISDAACDLAVQSAAARMWGRRLR